MTNAARGLIAGSMYLLLALPAEGQAKKDLNGIAIGMTRNELMSVAQAKACDVKIFTFANVWVSCERRPPASQYHQATYGKEYAVAFSSNTESGRITRVAHRFGSKRDANPNDIAESLREQFGVPAGSPKMQHGSTVGWILPGNISVSVTGFAIGYEVTLRDETFFADQERGRQDAIKKANPTPKF